MFLVSPPLQPVINLEDQGHVFNRPTYSMISLYSIMFWSSKSAKSVYMVNKTR